MSTNITNNTTFTLLDNLPFDTLDYNDALIVIENRFKSNLLLSRVDKINYISFSYQIKDINKKHKPFLVKLNPYVFYLVLFFVILLTLYAYIVYNNEHTYPVEIPLEAVNYK